MILSIKNDGYTFLIRLDLTFSISSRKEMQLWQIWNEVSIKRLIKLILYKRCKTLKVYKKYSIAIQVNSKQLFKHTEIYSL